MFRILLTIFLWAAPQTTTALTLSEAYAVALGKMETVAISEAAVRQAEQEYKRRIGLAYPTLSFVGNEFVQDVPASSGTVRRQTPELAFEFKHTFFSGLKEVRGIQISKSELKQQKLESRRVGQLLYNDVAFSFYGAVRREKELALLNTQGDVLGERVAELKRFEKLGRSRPSERLTVEADRKRLEADIEALKGDLIASNAVLSFLTGLSPLPPLDPGAEAMPEIPGFDRCLADLKERPDLLETREKIEAKKREVQFYQGSYWPTADVLADYYPYRVGGGEGIDWDVLLTLRWTLFAGGSTKAEVARTKAELAESELAYSLIERNAATDVARQLSILNAWTKRMVALKDAVRLLEENYKEQSREYRLGLVTNLDVLSAVTRLYDSKRAHETTRYEGKTAAAGLKVLTGKVPTP